MQIMNNTLIQKNIKKYYSDVLVTSADLKTSACCINGDVSQYLQKYLKNVHDEVQHKFYGCGSGRDCYLLAQLVGETGRVIGVDMTESQIAIARKYIDYHMDLFGFYQPNVEFHQGFIENLSPLDIAEESVDIIVSNCVINLSPDKEKVFREIFRLLKPGGELFFSDIFANRRIPRNLMSDPILVGECLSGAMYIEDFRRLLKSIGINDYRVVRGHQVDISDPEINAKIGMIEFTSQTIRVFKNDFEDICENYGHVAYYKGTIQEAPHEFVLDDHHVFETGLPVPVCGNTARMLSESRFGCHFDLVGDFSTHYGPFDCGAASGNHSAAGMESCC